MNFIEKFKELQDKFMNNMQLINKLNETLVSYNNSQIRLEAQIDLLIEASGKSLEELKKAADELRLKEVKKISDKKVK